MSAQEEERDVEITTTSQRGQVTIPKKVREKVKVEKGTKFAVYGSDDTVILKKVSVPSEEEFEKLVDWGTEHAEEEGISKEDVLEDD